MIDRYLLRYFLAVIDQGNFSRAAAACNVSQPTLSAGIAKLEASLGRPLFTRTNRRVALTEAGARLVARARRIEAEFAQAEREASAARIAGRLRLGVLTSMPTRWIADFVAALPRDSDEVELVEGRERELVDRLARGRIDAALTILRGNPRFAARPILSEPYLLALPAAHPLAAREVLAEELVDEPMIVRRHCELLGETSRHFTARGVRPFFPARTTSDDHARALIAAGLGVTVAPESFGGEGVAMRPLAEFDHVREVGVIAADATLLAHPLVERLADNVG
ncbi:LysR family transcriptional regulator [Sphingomonas sp. CL5.1]|uniref:LysR family transcriptional regulator n=1 Tax=Sphingomonas sp. CL5.1 TaxID=2653203 RepID=UPI0015837239|nr:LysR family transcriptional regulator [Sphingomonas sp. CL5.1]QKR98707.1 LysR family transcriptional regulator [Sphingomonas sp. CL5.1]